MELSLFNGDESRGRPISPHQLIWGCSKSPHTR